MRKYVLDENKHSKWGLSGAARYLRCPGSVALSEGVPAVKSIYAAEGTVAHHVASCCLVDDLSPDTFLGDQVSVDGHVVTVDHEMVDAVQTYMRAVFPPPDSRCWIEERVDLSVIHPDLFGTVDFASFSGHTLRVWDLKYGKGVKVWAYEEESGMNPQLAGYALGAYYSLLGTNTCYEVQDVELGISQPRLNHTSIHKVSIDFLLSWGAAVLRPGIIACNEMKHIRNPGSHCRFCLGRHKCPEYAELALDAPHLPPKVSRPTIPAPIEMTGDQLADVDDHASLLEAWVKMVREEIYNRLSSGKEVPGRKLVRGRSLRKWKSEQEAAKKLAELVGDGSIWKKKLVSPAQAEKLLKRHGFHPGAISEEVFKPEGKIKVAKDDDPRPREDLIEWEDEV